MQDNKGNLPLYYACNNESSSSNTINMHVDLLPNSITCKDGLLFTDLAAAINSDLQYLARSGTLPESGHNFLDPNIYIENKTGCQLKIEYCAFFMNTHLLFLESKKRFLIMELYKLYFSRAKYKDGFYG